MICILIFHLKFRNKWKFLNKKLCYLRSNLNFYHTLARSRSTAFIKDPWKYFILVCWRFKSPSSSRSGSALKNINFKPSMLDRTIPLGNFKLVALTSHLPTCEERPLQHQHLLCLHGGNPWESVRRTHR